MLKPLEVKTLLNPCSMNMNVSSDDPRNISLDVKFCENPLDYQYYRQWLQMRERQNVFFHHSAEFQRNFKKSKISESMKEYSTSRMSNSSPSRSKQARPTKDLRQTCLKFRRGNCNYGDRCIFAHDETGDPRKSFDPNRVGIVGGDRLCKYLMSGISCPYGDSCYFNHHLAENVKGGSGVHRENTSITLVNSRGGEEYRKRLDGRKSAAVENLNSAASQIRQCNMFWKTRLCRKWETRGCCPYGIKCQYAHGRTELRKLGSFNQDSEKFFRVGNVAVDTENAASTEKTIKISFKQQEESEKCLDKWNSIAKINCIYADWIETSPPVHAISGNQ